MGVFSILLCVGLVVAVFVFMLFLGGALMRNLKDEEDE